MNDLERAIKLLNAFGYECKKQITGTGIKALRKHLGYNMKDFGKLFDPPASSGLVSNWEHGYNDPNETRAKQIFELAINNGFILKEEDFY